MKSQVIKYMKKVRIYIAALLICVLTILLIILFTSCNTVNKSEDYDKNETDYILYP